MNCQLSITYYRGFVKRSQEEGGIVYILKDISLSAFFVSIAQYFFHKKVLDTAVSSAVILESSVELLLLDGE